MKKKGVFQFSLGIIIGAAIFGGATAYAAGIMAQPRTAAIVIDGEAVDLEGYLIEDRHYFQLRDLDEKLMPGGKDFSIVWDEANRQVLIDTSRGYDPNETLPPAVPETEQGPAMTVEELKAEIVRLTNIERANAGQAELEALPALMGAAQAKADDMRQNHYYGHVSPVYGTPGEMIKAALPSTKSCAENIASWTKTPQEVVAGLMDSPKHRENMLSPKYAHIGVGIIVGAGGGYWWVVHYAGLYQ